MHWCQYHEVGYAKNLRPFLEDCSLGYTLDVKQAAQSGYPMEGYLEEMGDRLCNLHLCDITEQEQMVYTSLPGQGNFDFVHLAALLREKNFNGAVTMEVYPDDWEKENELRQSFAFLRALFE